MSDPSKSEAVARIKAKRAARRRRRADKRGVALIMTMGAITVLTVFLTQLQEETSAELAAALAERDALKAEYFARSGVNLARLLIAIEPQIRKSLPLPIKTQIPVWSFADMVLGPFNDASSGMAFNGMINADPSTGKNLGMSGGRFEVKIVDEESKINLNTAAKGDTISKDKVARQLLGLISSPQYQPLFEQPDLDNQRSDRQMICASLIDWTDDDEFLYPCDPFTQVAQAGSTGGEDNFYQTIGLGYRRRNSAFDSLEEVRLVRGIGDDFWATFVDPDPNDPGKRVVTVWGLDRVNVNTAAPQAVLGIICSDKGAQLDPRSLCNDPVQLQSFLMGMSMLRGFLMGMPIFQSPGDFVDAMQGKGFAGGIFAALGVQPVVFQAPKEVQKQVGMKSQMFSIYAEGFVTGNKMSMSASGNATAAAPTPQVDANGNPIPPQLDANGNPVNSGGSMGGSSRRTPRVRIHAVVDFRTATDLGAPTVVAFGQNGGGVTPPQAAAAAASAAANNAGAAGMTAMDYEKMISANPAGKIVYWRVE